MPQIWMTYQELGRLLNSDPEAAREVAYRRGLDRKKSRDGFTRAKLNMELMALFIAEIRAQPGDLDRSIDDLRHVHDAIKRVGTETDRVALQPASLLQSRLRS